jgi:HAD superfamily hydrolase (TIGR01490 family)
MGGSTVISNHFAAFDIDGTIFRWQLYHELFDAFVEEGIITPTAAQPVLAARNAWRERLADYQSYEHELIHATQAAIVGIEENTFNATCDTILKSKGHHVYRFTLNLLKQLKSEGYTIVAISGSHQQLVDRFARIHGIDIAVGRNHIIQNGKLTGAATEIFGQKEKILRNIVTQNNLSWEKSYAVGDSGGDADMLRLVENPIAFNPDETLKSIATEHGWPIIVERKSIAYRLEKGRDGTYVLA